MRGLSKPAIRHLLRTFGSDCSGKRPASTSSNSWKAFRTFVGIMGAIAKPRNFAKSDSTGSIGELVYAVPVGTFIVVYHFWMDGVI